MSIDLDFISTKPMPFAALDKKTDYISREDALSMLDGIYDCNDMVFENDSCAGRDCASCRWYDTKKYIRGRVANLPAADVRPVVRGKWKDAVQGCHDSPHVKCSVCGEYYWKYFEKFNFCPNCGADMREES